MKKLFSILFIYTLSLGSIVFSQTYGNEWINFSQEYYKIETAQDGLYVLDNNYFTNSGLDVSGLDPRNFHFYHRGQEISILIEGESDGSFDVGDRILFLGKRNDGVLDSSLYLQQAQPHQYYNLMVDTTAYFLTWNNTPGKRVSISNLPSTGIAESAFNVEKLKVFTDEYLFGQEQTSFIFYSEFDKGEGWFSKVTTKGNSLSHTFEDLNLVVGDSLTLEVMLVGANRMQHACQIQVGSFQYTINSFEGYTTQTQILKVPVSAINSNSLTIQLNVLGTASADAVSIAYYKLNYASTESVSLTDPYYFSTSGLGEQDAKLRGANGGYLFDITDPQHVVCVALAQDGLNLNYTYNSNSTMVYAAENSLIEPVLMKKAEFLDDASSGAAFLLVTHTDFMAACQDYKTYRESEVGGGLNVMLADVNRLYNQYSYGERSPIAIRNFTHYLYAVGDPKYLFLVSMGRVVSMQNGNKPYNRKLEFHNSFYNSKNYVPTMGNPGSDILYTTGLLPNTYEPALATGRLSIWDGAQMSIYLNKVKEYESQTDVGYRKRALHLSGGKTESERSQFLGYMSGFEATFQNSNIGGEVTSFTKKTSDEIEFINISKEVNEGVSIINTFSHSSPQVTEIDIGEVSNAVNGYENKGKYPIIFINGCHAGDAYNAKNDADNWLFSTADKGAIAWIAHSSYGYASFLNRYSDLFYDKLFTTDSLWTAPIGMVQKAVINEFMNTSGYEMNSIALSHYAQVMIQGDPYISIFPYDEADFAITNSFLSPSTADPISAASDSITLNIVVRNQSRAISDSIDICINRSFQGGNFDYESIRIKSPFNQDTVSVILSNANAASGLNEFSTTVNCNYLVPEVDSSNNTFSLNYFFNENVALPLIPVEFSIVGDAVVTFIAQSANRNIQEKATYLFELDTTISFIQPLIEKSLEAFNYPELKNIELPVKIDSTVFYWRIGLVSDIDTVWSTSSFTYINNKFGFSQTDFDQFYKVNLENVSRDLQDKRWVFDSVFTEVDPQSAGVGVSRYWRNSFVRVNGQSVILQGKRGNCTADGVFLLTFDKVTGLPYNINGIDNGSCGNRPRIAESFPTHDQWSGGGRLNNPVYQSALQNYIENVASGDYILIVSDGNAYYDTWSIELKNAVESIGAQFLDQLVNGEPYILLGKKGSAVADVEQRGAAATDIINVVYNLSGQFDQAQLSSPTIGPALSWSTFYRTIDTTLSDRYNFDIVGITTDGSETILFSEVGNEIDSLDISATDASQYPFLKLRTQLKDTIGLTSPQLKNWGITYESPNEGLILYNLIDNKFKEIHEYVEDEVDTLGIWFKNITEIDFNDSIDVVYMIYNLESSFFIEDTITVWGPDALDSIYVEIPIQGVLGINNFAINVNPKGVQELSLINNYFDGQFLVTADFSQFVLDVTFDGVHIKNGDVVSKFPLIDISTFNNYAKYETQDTTSILMYIKDVSCVSCSYESIYFTDVEVTISNNNRSTGMDIRYAPKDLKEGSYELRIVNVENQANPFIVQFQVKETFSLSTLKMYPNPTSGNVFVSFSMTGEQVPDAVSLKLYSNTGTLVGQLEKADIPFLHVGKNTLKLSTDRLGSGLFIYLFEVIYKGQTFIQKGKLVKL